MTGLMRIGRLASFVCGMSALLLPPHGASGQDDPGGAPATRLQAELRLGVYDPLGEAGGVPQVSIEHIFMPWEEIDWITLVEADAYAASRQRDLLISVEPWSWSGNQLTNDEQVDAILSGQFDEVIDTVCARAAGLNSRVTLRWAHEMDETSGRYGWSGLRPDRYVSAYRYFVDTCRRSAPNVHFMWSPKGEETAATFYPGNDYVDVVGISVFGLQAYDEREFGRKRTFKEATGERYGRVSAFGKRIVVAEFGVSGDDGYVADWIEAARCRDDDFPLLDGVVYFNAEDPHAWPEDYGRPDWRIDAGLLNQDCDLKTTGLLGAGTQSTSLSSDDLGQTAGSAEAASELSASRVEELYAGRSWIWPDGAGYFAPDGRFAAWSGEGETASSAAGRWRAEGGGVMCVTAIWCSSGPPSQTSMCFSHHESGSIVYQRKEPSGEWYELASEDEVADGTGSLVEGDIVTGKLSEVQAAGQAKQCAPLKPPVLSQWSAPPFRGAFPQADAPAVEQTYQGNQAPAEIQLGFRLNNAGSTLQSGVP